MIWSYLGDHFMTWWKEYYIPRQNTFYVLAWKGVQDIDIDIDFFKAKIKGKPQDN